jgi:hypothetical protein
MERAARIRAAEGQVSAATLKALRCSWGRTLRLGLGDDLGWRACRRNGRDGRVTAGCPAGMQAGLDGERGFVPPPGARWRQRPCAAVRP